MPVLEWSDELWVGNDRLAELHVAFVALLNELADSRPDTVLDALDRFADHCERQFTEEEGWMRTSGFPRTSCHLLQHDALLRVARDVRTRLVAGEVDLVAPLTNAVSGWFRDHVTFMDTMLANYMEAIGYTP